MAGSEWKRSSTRTQSALGRRESICATSPSEYAPHDCLIVSDANCSAVTEGMGYITSLVTYTAMSKYYMGMYASHRIYTNRYDKAGKRRLLQIYLGSKKSSELP